MDGQERHLIAGRSPATEGDPGAPSRRSAGAGSSAGDSSEVVPSERGRWDTLYPAFAAAVRGEGPVPVDPGDAVRALEVIEAAERSAESGAVVPL